MVFNYTFNDIFHFYTIIKTNRKQFKCQTIRAQFEAKRTLLICLEVIQPAVKKSQPEDTNKHPDT